MDGDRFAAMARVVGSGPLRSAVLKLLGGGALGALLHRLGIEEAAAACGRVDRRRGADADCRKGGFCFRGCCQCKPGFTECVNSKGLCYDLDKRCPCSTECDIVGGRVKCAGESNVDGIACGNGGACRGGRCCPSGGSCQSAETPPNAPRPTPSGGVLSGGSPGE